MEINKLETLKGLINFTHSLFECDYINNVGKVFVIFNDFYGRIEIHSPKSFSFKEHLSLNNDSFIFSIPYRFIEEEPMGIEYNTLGEAISVKIGKQRVPFEYDPFLKKIVFSSFEKSTSYCDGGFNVEQGFKNYL